MLNTNPVLSGLYDFAQPLGNRTPGDFLIAQGLGAFVLIIVSAAYRTLTQYPMNRHIEMRRHSIGSRLLEIYLRQPYAFFLGSHSGDMSKTILSEVDQLIFRPSPMHSLAEVAFSNFPSCRVLQLALLIWLRPAPMLAGDAG